MGAPSPDPDWIRDIAKTHHTRASQAEASGNATVAAALRATSNLLYAIANCDPSAHTDPLPPPAAEPTRQVAPGDIVVVKAIGEIMMRIDGPKLAYVVQLEHRAFDSAIKSPSWSGLRTTFVLPDEVSTYGAGPLLSDNDRRALQAWVDHLVDEYAADRITDPSRELERRGREILERLLGR